MYLYTTCIPRICTCSFICIVTSVHQHLYEYTCTNLHTCTDTPVSVHMFFPTPVCLHQSGPLSSFIGLPHVATHLHRASLSTGGFVKALFIQVISALMVLPGWWTMPWEGWCWKIMLMMMADDVDKSELTAAMFEEPFAGAFGKTAWKRMWTRQVA